MFKKLFKRVWKNEKGITGLETAIILIAFVVVAAVFAYTVLSAGLFSTQKSQETVYSGLQQVSSTLEIKGDIVGKASVTGASGEMGQLTFTVANALGGEPIDFTAPTADTNTGKAKAGSNNVVVISYIDKNQHVQDLYWTKEELSGDGDDLLEEGEKFQITVGGVAGAAGSLVQALDPDLSVNTTFTIEMASTKGPILSFQRTTPAYFDSVMTLR